MEELTRWVDSDQTRRGFKIVRSPLWASNFEVYVWDTDSDGNPLIEGHGTRSTLTFAVVEALLDYEKNLKGAD